ncbi:hypothetical protein ABK905_11960 [Acerihabitans sp. KWT182]|uniref:Uncharacterized protein n=1 Tax=Acerihabitans sp. KWT182 TaxID=3157919 RepID=A0AAU7QET0_9GAMM
MAKRVLKVNSSPLTSTRTIEQPGVMGLNKIKRINSTLDNSQEKRSLYKVKTHPYFSLKNILWLGISLLGNAAFIHGAVRSRLGDNTIAKTSNNVAEPLIVPQPLAMEKFLRAEEYVEMMQGDQAQLGDVNDPYQAYAPTCKSTDSGTRLEKTNKEVIRLLKKNALLDNAKKPHQFKKVDILVALAKLLSEKTDQIKTKLARIILKISGRYGGHVNEPLSESQVNKLVDTWLFENTLGETLDVYVARQTAASLYPFMLTVDSLRYWLSLDVVSADHGSLAFLSESDRQTFDALWQGALERQIPLLAYYANHPEVKILPLDDMSFSALYSGSLLLSDQGINLKKIPLKTVIQTGLGLWQMALEEGIALDMLKYFTLPAILYDAIQGKDKTPADCYHNEIITRSAAVEKYLRHVKDINDENIKFLAIIENYKKETRKWLNRGALADRYIDLCPPNSLKSLSGYKDPFFNS